MRLGDINIQIGGFHDHWLRNGTDVSSILIAAVTRYHYDFICLMDAEFGDKAQDIKNQLEKWIPGLYYKSAKNSSIFEKNSRVYAENGIL